MRTAAGGFNRLDTNPETGLKKAKSNHLLGYLPYLCRPKIFYEVLQLAYKVSLIYWIGNGYRRTGT